MLTEEGVKKAVSRIALMPFFPSSDPNARALVFEDIVNICESDAHAEWLSMRFCQVFRNGWPGLEELRAVYCARFKPCDKRFADSHAYPDGIPSEQETGIVEVKGLPALCPPQRLLTKFEEQLPDAHKLLVQFMDPDPDWPGLQPNSVDGEEYRRTKEAIARRNGDLPAGDRVSEPAPPIPLPPARARTSDELAQLDRLRLEIDQLRTAELARRAAKESA